jgi:DNA-binding transcriptional LysR family regulator
MNNGLLEQARAFVAIVNSGSLSAAATFLGVAQPTISRQLASLEESLGCNLIQRSTRALTLTSDGENFLPHAIQMIETADAAVDAMRPVKTCFTGRLRVSCSHAFGKRILIPALPNWQRMHPGLRIELFLSDDVEPIVPLGLDLAIRVGQLEDSNLIARKIGEFERFLVASKEYVATHPDVTAPQDLMQHACVTVSVFARKPWVFIKGSDTVSVDVKGTLTVSTVDSLREAVLAGLGFGLTPTWFWTNELQLGEVVRLLPDYRIESKPMYAVSAYRHASNSKEFAFVEFLKDAFRPHLSE